MKTPKFLNSHISLKTLLFGILLLGVAAWSPPTGDTKIIVGTNTVTGGRVAVIGQSNSHNGTDNLMVGNGNTVNGPGHTTTNPVPAYNSAALGWGNLVAASRGWAFGWDNDVVADKGVAIGTGTISDSEMGVALGRFNDPMAAGDILVVGNGIANDVVDENGNIITHNRSTALTITSDGDVILGKAQGDISMGDYGN